MKNIPNILTAIGLFYCTTTVAQDRKHYIEDNGKLQQTTQAIFQKSIDHSKNVDVYLENDTSEIAVLYTRRRKGKLDAEKMMTLKNFLRQSGISINDNEYICINYQTSTPVNDPVQSGMYTSSLEKKIQKKLSVIVPSKYVRVYSPGGRNDGFSEKQKQTFLADDSHLIHKMFFPVEFNYANVVVVKPDGTYQVYFGEHNPDEIYKMTEALKAMP